MSFIEHLENDLWQDNFRLFFEHTLQVIKTDPYSHVGSAVDDLRAWIRQGGIKRVKDRLLSQMKERRFSEKKQQTVMDFFDALVQEHQRTLTELRRQHLIPYAPSSLLNYGMTEVELQALFERILAGERPFEDWMYAHGYAEKDINQVYKVIDKCMIEQELIPIPFPSEKIH